MKRWRKWAAGCLALLLAVFAQTGFAGALRDRENQAILLTLPGLTWDAISPRFTPNLRRMLESGGAANLVLPSHGDDTAGYRAMLSGSRDSADPDALAEAVAASGGRVAAIRREAKDEALYREYLSLRERANFLTMEIEELERLASNRKNMALDEFKDRYVAALAEADRFIGNLLNDTDRSRLLIVAAPVSFADMGVGHRSAGVVLMEGGGVAPNSLLASNSTRQTGLVTVYDIAPTVLAHLGLSSGLKNGIGHTIGTVASDGPSVAYLMNRIGNMERVNQYRPYLAKGFALAAFALILAALRWRGAGGRVRVAHLLTGITALPAVYLLFPVFGESPPGEAVLKLVSLSAAAWLGLSFLKTVRDRLLAVSVVTLCLTTLDMLRQGRWMKDSVLGYDLLGGARFYGIGNEYAGILIGVSLAAYFILLNRFWHRRQRVKLLGGLSFALITCLLAAPQFGSNAGGALAAAIAYLYVLTGATDRQTLRKKWVRVLGGSLTVLIGMATWHLLPPATEQTHIGRAAGLLLRGEIPEIAEMAARKLALNLRLLAVSPWGGLLLAVGLVLVLNLLRPDRFRQSAFTPSSFGANAGEEGPPPVACAFLVAGAAVFLLNDSGVLAAAGLMLYAAVGFLAEETVHGLTAPAAPISDESAGERTS